jgi:hypothetical protein
MSNKTKFFLVIGMGALVITVGTVLLFNMAGNYSDTSAAYYLFVGLSILFFVLGVAIIIIWTSKLED